MLQKIVRGKIVSVEDEILKEDNTLDSALKELRRYICEDGIFDKKICETTIKFLETHVDDPRISWDHNLFEYRILRKVLERLELARHTTSLGEFKEISNKVLYKSIGVLKGLKEGRKFEKERIRRLETLLSKFKFEYDLYKKNERLVDYTA